MNDQARDSAPPEEPYLRAELSIQSPASPKPVQLPQPTNIPVLENMMDVGFNQTELHMADPAMHQTELRADAWRDPNEQPSTNTGANEQPAADSTTEPTASADTGEQPEGQSIVNGDGHSNDAAPNGHDAQQLVSLSNGASYEANSHISSDVANETSTNAPLPTSSDPSVPTADAEHEPAPIAEVAQLQSNEANTDQSQQPPAHGSVDVQALLDTLQTSIAPSDNATPHAQGDATSSHSQTQPPPPGAETSSMSATGLAAPPSGLPPRPPPQDQPLINSNYVHSQHIRDYHPHAASPAVQSQSHARSNSLGSADPAQTQQAGASSSASHGQASSAAPTQHNGQGPASAQQQQQQYPVSSTPIESRREFKIAAGQTPTKEDQPWTADIQKKYDHFMEEERKYVNEARWDQFPVGSRLFVGNLSSEKVTKRDIFHVFHNYGELAQISIKQAYGFVQFLRKEDCARALQAEQGRQIRDKRIHLEISKPQKSGNKNQQQSNRRSRSPEYPRGRPGNNDRYGGRGANGRDGRDGRDGRGRDAYRGGYRSPSPRGYRDRYEERYRTRSRSPGYGRYRGSPRRESDDDCPLPRRQPHDVPDVQIIALDQLDRDFLSWAEKAFTARGVRVDVLILSPRLNEEAVMRRQIVEGVLAVSKLRRANQNSGKIGLTIFKRKHGIRDVQYEEYDSLDPHICAELVLREKSTTGGGPPSAGGYSGPQYGAPQYGYQQSGPPPPFVPPTGYPPGYGQQQPQQAPAPFGAHPPQAPTLPTNMDPNNLQNLLSTLNQPSPHTPQAAGHFPHAAPSPYPPNQQQQQYGQPPNNSYAAYQNNPALAGMMPPQQQHGHGHGQPPAPNAQGGQPNMQDILARLGTYRQ